MTRVLEGTRRGLVGGFENEYDERNVRENAKTFPERPNRELLLRERS